MIMKWKNGTYTTDAEFGKEIIKAREALNLTAAQLAKVLDTSPSTICRMETGKSKFISEDMILRLEEALDIKFVATDVAGAQFVDEYLNRIEELEEENRTLKSLLMKYWS